MSRFDFGGYATRNNVRCSDGRTIRRDAFKDCDGRTVPLVWQHRHDSPENVLGHALLENRQDGVYAYCTFNDTPMGENSKKLVEHGDIEALSIYANQLQQNGPDVVHGMIREVSLVLSGANPGAFIETVSIAHSDGIIEDIDDEAVIYSGANVDSFAHAEGDSDGESENNDDNGEEEDVAKEEKSDKTLEDVFNTLTDEQKDAVYAIIGLALEEDADDEDEDGEEVKHSGFEGDYMKYNVFDDESNGGHFLSHADQEAIFADAKRTGSLKEAVLQHGITDIDVLFPEAQMVGGGQPALIARNMEWVDAVLGGVNKTPFSRVKSTAANLTAAEARARGYIKGHQKVEEQISALKRVTTPQTIYKLQKLDRDDVIDITDFDVVTWLKSEMRMMLNEELARAILISDGRSSTSNDKINELNIRPIYTDAETYAVHTSITVAANATSEDIAKQFIDAAIRAKKNYKGSGAPTLFVGTDMLTELRLIKDGQGHRLYKSDTELANDLRVSKIVEVGLFDNQTRTVNGAVRHLDGIIVNLRDYTVGADRGGEVSLFDDFDLDYNKYEYLIETRCSGALTQPASALVLEHVVTGEVPPSTETTDPTTDPETTEGE